MRHCSSPSSIPCADTRCQPHSLRGSIFQNCNTQVGLQESKENTLERSLELANHSPSSFDWGYAGSSPAQLAFALLLDYTDDEDVALAEYMDFKTEVVSQLECTEPNGCWRLTGREIDAALRDSFAYDCGEGSVAVVCNPAHQYRVTKAASGIIVWENTPSSDGFSVGIAFSRNCSVPPRCPSKPSFFKIGWQPRLLTNKIHAPTPGVG